VQSLASVPPGRAGGGTGRRWGLKIPCPVKDVWVRIPPGPVGSETVGSGVSSSLSCSAVAPSENAWRPGPDAATAGDVADVRNAAPPLAILELLWRAIACSMRLLCSAHRAQPVGMALAPARMSLGAEAIV
jgi:hypothetical protein